MTLSELQIRRAGPGLPANKLRRAHAWTKELLRNRWLGLAAASWVEATAGIGYMFGLYSQSFKDNLGYDQTMVDLVGMAKDIGGNVGIVSGFVGDAAPPWVSLAVGAVQNLIGYAGVWLVLSGRLQGVPPWAVMVLICVGTNGATFFNTGALVTCVKNFPLSRGPVVGLLKGFIGLSGAIFTQLYLALYAPDHNALLLMVSWVPVVIAVMAMPAIHLLPSATNDPHERASLFLILLSSVGLALFLLAASLVEHFVSLGRVWNFLVSVLSFAVLATPALVAVEQVAVKESEGEQEEGSPGGGEEERARRIRAGGESERALLLEGPLGRGEEDLPTRQHQGWVRSLAAPDSVGTEQTAKRRQRSPSGQAEGESGSDIEEGTGSGMGRRHARAAEGKRTMRGEGPDLSPTPRRSTRLGIGLKSGTGGVGEESACSLQGPEGKEQEEEEDADRTWSQHPQSRSPRRGAAGVLPPLKIGEDHSLVQAAATPSFWLVYVAMTGASGSGLTAINNLGQFGRALGYGQAEIGIFVSLMSVWNFLGRAGAGYVSEYFMQDRGVPRPVFMVLTQLVMAVGHLVFASAAPGSLYVGSVLVGLTYGAQWGLMPAVASEIFGLRHFGTLYNWLTITNPTGSYLLSVCVAGYLYDYEARKEASSLPPPYSVRSAAQVAGALPPGSMPPVCHGAHCFRETFLIMATACVAAAGLSAVLVAITRQYYAAEFFKRRPSPVAVCDEGSEPPEPTYR